MIKMGNSICHKWVKRITVFKNFYFIRVSFIIQLEILFYCGDVSVQSRKNVISDRKTRFFLNRYIYF